MTVLALDLGTRAGWALHHNCGTRLSGWISLKGGRYEGGGMRFLRFQRWLDEIHTASGFNEVYFEEVRRHRGTDAAHVYGGLLATLTSWCEAKNIAYQGVPVGAIKKHATGNGAASKEMMIAAAHARGVTSDDDNEVDAWWLLDLKVAEQEALLS